MASTRMMLAIGALERAIGRLEQQVDALGDAPSTAAPVLSPQGTDQARAALQSLDDLIAELKGRTDG
ncbi:hypothetical protein GGR44_001380 [Sphingobium fontiphilum]|uniref:Uncharacterized protein n=1 Tax=Sphingobium fontiphilum TaxID=944425 RepID=A0A7W6DKX3_9SPHN|nr:hypothetical protein [Sphingobium fontiphilum]MBB3981733.1 hypothetical protein [Sphingobium fontiphilum]